MTFPSVHFEIEFSSEIQTGSQFRPNGAFKITIVRDEAVSSCGSSILVVSISAAVSCLHQGRSAGCFPEERLIIESTISSNWKLECLWRKENRRTGPEKNLRSKARTNKTLNSHLATGRNRTRATLVGGTLLPKF